MSHICVAGHATHLCTGVRVACVVAWAWQPSAQLNVAGNAHGQLHAPSRMPACSMHVAMLVVAAFVARLPRLAALLRWASCPADDMGPCR